MSTPEMLEAAMLIAFSISWYWSIAKMLRSRVAAGKSALFVALICAGYVAGVGSKTLAWAEGAPLSPLAWLYAWNLCVTLVDLALVMRFSKPAMAEAAQPS